MLIHFIHGYYCIYRPWQPLTYLYFPYHCISLIYFSFTMIRMFLYAQMYWLAEFGDVSSLQFNYLRVETLTPTWEDLVGHLSDNLVGHLSVWSPTKLCVRPECLIVDTLGGIYSTLQVYQRSYSQVRQIPPKMSDKFESQHSLSPTIWSDILVGRESGY